MRRLVKLGVVGDNLVCELETTGRQTGQLRRVPVSPMFDEKGAWVVCGHGTRSGWGANITANPRVRLKRGHVWFSGTARFVPDDDLAKRLAAYEGIGPKVAAKGTRPVSVRIDFDGR
jgi:deazaflavin-dependent oxidoreductase (nitroreductase family)